MFLCLPLRPCLPRAKSSQAYFNTIYFMSETFFLLFPEGWDSGLPNARLRSYIVVILSNLAARPLFQQRCRCGVLEYKFSAIPCSNASSIPGTTENGFDPRLPEASGVKLTRAVHVVQKYRHVTFSARHSLEVQRVEWRIERASELQRCFPAGSALMIQVHSEFSIANLELVHGEANDCRCTGRIQSANGT